MNQGHTGHDATGAYNAALHDWQPAQAFVDTAFHNGNGGTNDPYLMPVTTRPKGGPTHIFELELPPRILGQGRAPATHHPFRHLQTLRNG